MRAELAELDRASTANAVGQGLPLRTRPFQSLMSGPKYQDSGPDRHGSDRQSVCASGPNRSRNGLLRGLADSVEFMEYR